MRIQVVVACLVVALVMAHARISETPTTSALAAQISTRMCMKSGDTVNVTLLDGAGAHILYVFRSSQWWETWIPATSARVQQCLTWARSAVASYTLSPHRSITFTVPDGNPPDFWFIGVSGAGCSGNVSRLSYDTSVHYADLATNDFECMSINERAWSEIFMEWMAIRNSDVFNVRNLGTLSIVFLYFGFGLMTALCIMFAVTSGKNVEQWGVVTGRLSVLVCLLGALMYYTLATGTGFGYVYRNVNSGGWTWDDQAASARAMNASQAPVVYPIPISRFAIRPVTLGMVSYLVARHMGYTDWYIGVVTSIAFACQLCASMVLTPSKWVMAFVGWVCMGATCTMIHRGAKMSQRVFGAMMAIWFVDTIIWISMDALHTMPIWIGIVAHLLVDVFGQGLLLLALRRGAYKRATPIDLGVDEAEEGGIGYPPPCHDARLVDALETMG